MPQMGLMPEPDKRALILSIVYDHFHSCERQKSVLFNLGLILCFPQRSERMAMLARTRKE